MRTPGGSRGAGRCGDSDRWWGGGQGGDDEDGEEVRREGGLEGDADEEGGMGVGSRGDGGEGRAGERGRYPGGGGVPGEELRQIGGDRKHRRHHRNRNSQRYYWSAGMPQRARTLICRPGQRFVE